MVEYDIIEAYGGVAGDSTNRQVHTSVHLVPALQPAPDAPGLVKRRHKSRIRKMPADLFDGQWHTYGGLVTPEWIITYMDRKEVARFKTIPEARQPRYLLLDLDDIKGLARPGPYRIDIDRVSVWALPAR